MLELIDVNAELERIANSDNSAIVGELLTLLRRVTKERDNAVDEIRALHAEAQPCAAS